ncbi:MAG: argininosuccinate lyase [Spirochaetota bacterium]
MAKLWDKGYSLNELVERFTVGNDYLLDRRLVAADAVASIAHARMLAHVGILPDDDVAALERELRTIATEAVETGCTIRRDQEDGHTYIEERLVERLGEPGKRIHTGRSRNDQVVASTRLFAREGVLVVRSGLADAVDALLGLAREHERTPMAGRTHMQPAMPSTVGLWAASYAEALLDADAMIAGAYRLLNRSPLGAAASYGVPLPLDRERVAELLGFAGVQHNVLWAVTSRGQLEVALLDALDHAGIALSRFATDLILYSLPEFGYFSLPPELCTGSSIMPQKRNPDGLELLRGKSGVLSSHADRLRAIVRSLPSSYNRDVQEAKEPLLAGIDLAVDMLAVAALSARNLKVHPERLRAGFTGELFATDAAIDRVNAGQSFRDAYRAVAAELGSIEASDYDVDEVIARRSATGAPGNLDLPYVEDALARVRDEVSVERERVVAAVARLAGAPLPLYPGAPADR